jgi:hypothetical protein
LILELIIAKNSCYWRKYSKSNPIIFLQAARSLLGFLLFFGFSGTIVDWQEFKKN